MGAFWHEAGLVQLTTIKPGAYQRCPARGLGVNPYPPDPWAHLKNPAPPRTCHSHSHTHTPMSTPTSAHRIFKNKQEKGSCEGSTRGARARGACANSPTRQEKGVGEGGRRERERERRKQAYTHTLTHTQARRSSRSRETRRCPRVAQSTRFWKGRGGGFEQAHTTPLCTRRQYKVWTTPQRRRTGRKGARCAGDDGELVRTREQREQRRTSSRKWLCSPAVAAPPHEQQPGLLSRPFPLRAESPPSAKLERLSSFPRRRSRTPRRESCTPRSPHLLCRSARASGSSLALPSSPLKSTWVRNSLYKLVSNLYHEFLLSLYFLLRTQVFKM